MIHVCNLNQEGEAGIMFWQQRRSISPKSSRGRGLKPRLDTLESRCLLSGYNVRLDTPSEAGTSIAGRSQPYNDIADFQATDPNGNAVTNPAGFTATINWGDGISTAGSINPLRGVPGRFEVDGSHAYPYPSNGEYNIQVTLADPAGSVWYGRPSTATVDPPTDYFGSNPGNGENPSSSPSPTPISQPQPASPSPNPGQPIHANPGGTSRQFKLHAHKYRRRQNPSHRPAKTGPSIPVMPPTGPLQRVFPNPTGYTSFEFVGLKFNHQTPESVMAELEKNPSRYFPFPITKNNPGSSTGPIAEGQTYKLTPVPFMTDVLKAVNVKKTSFTLVVIGKHYVVPAGSRITFKTVVDIQGDVLLEQDAFVSDQLHVFPDQVFGPPAWAQQAANLRRDLGYTF